MKDLSYYVFDHDDNLLNTNTIIHLEHKIKGRWQPCDVSTQEFAIIRNNPLYRPIGPEAFIEFSDQGPRGDRAFFEDCITAIKAQKFGPSWNDFLNCIIEGHLCAIITSRSHASQTIRNVVEYIIHHILTETQRYRMLDNLRAYQVLFRDFHEDIIGNYLNHCFFMGVTSPDYMARFGDTGTVEEKKIIALNAFIQQVVSYGQSMGLKSKMGFSDDDREIFKSIKKYMKNEWSLQYLDFDFYAYNTGQSKIQKYKISHGREKILKK
jgi:hypothetical protein